MGCARDIVEHVGVPRFYFSNFPLGHSAGKPFDAASQHQTVREALALVDQANTARTTAVSTQKWSNDDRWEQDFWDVSQLSPQQLKKLKAEHEQVRQTAANIKSNG